MLLENLQAEIVDALFHENKAVQEEHYPHIDLYRQAIYSTLTNHLKSIYPLSLQLLGESLFNKMSEEYINHYPALSPILSDYGEYFSNYFGHDHRIEKYSYLIDLAQFEWAIHSMPFSANIISLDIALLQSVPASKCDNLSFVLHPTIVLKGFSYPVLEIIKACEKNDFAAIINIQKKATYLLMMRKEGMSLYFSLHLDEFSFLTALYDNKSLSTALNEVKNINPHFNLEKNLIDWIKNKIIVDVVF